MNSEKSVGTNREPWGTPLVMGARLEWVPLTDTHCCLLVRKEVRRLRVLGCRERRDSLQSKVSCWRESKAFAKSMNKMPMDRLFFCAVSHLLCKVVMRVEQE